MAEGPADPAPQLDDSFNDGTTILPPCESSSVSSVLPESIRWHYALFRYRFRH